MRAPLTVCPEDHETRMAAQALRSAVAAAGDEKAQGAALGAWLAALAAPGSDLDKSIAEVVKLSTETVHSDDTEACVATVREMTEGLLGSVCESFRRAHGAASDPFKAEFARIEMAAVVSIKKAELPPPPAELPPLSKWTHPTRGVLPVESAARYTGGEWEKNLAALQAEHCAADEVIAGHFSSNGSAHLIVSEKSHGLRASTVGQLNGGVSLCKGRPHEMHWEQYARGGFRDAVGQALWGEKKADVLLGGVDEDKLDLLFVVKLKKAFFDDPTRQVEGRPMVRRAARERLVAPAASLRLPRLHSSPAAVSLCCAPDHRSSSCRGASPSCSPRMATTGCRRRRSWPSTG